MPFAVPMIWKKPASERNCYFCQILTTGYSKKNKGALEYPDFCTATRPLKHSTEYPVPTPPQGTAMDRTATPELSASNVVLNDSSADQTFVRLANAKEPQLFSQAELNDLVREFAMTKDDAEVLASRLKHKEICSFVVQR